jgi:hypothetical protein
VATAITLRQIKEAALTNLGLIMFVVADTVDTTNHTVRASDVWNKAPDPFLVRDAFFVGREANDTGNQYRRIVKFAAQETPDTLVLAGGPDGITAGDDCAVYFLLNPDEIKGAVNDALSEMWKRLNIPFDFVQYQTDYPVDDMVDPDDAMADCSWVTVRGQIETVKTKWIIQTGLVQEQEWAGYTPIESNNSVTLHFTYLPPYQTDGSVTGILVANKPYVYPGAELENDDDTTNCPMKLAQMGAAVKILRLCYKKYGTDSMRARFGSTLALMEQEWAKAKIMMMPPMRSSSYLIEETYAADIPDIMTNPPW